MPDDASKIPTASTATMAMSSPAKARLRAHEQAKYCYYDDGGKPGVGNCTWGIGILAHLGPCTAKELKTKVEPAQVEASFATRVADAERVVRRDVKRQQLTQAQFDALVSLVYNLGENRGADTLDRVDAGKFELAARGISQMVKMRVKTKKGWKYVIARGLIKRRAEESAPFRAPAQ